MLPRDLDRRGIFPPIDVLLSLSRLASANIGADRTREDHRDLADHLYARYVRGRQVRDLASVVGTAALGEDDCRYHTFADNFEQRFVRQATAGATHQNARTGLGVARRVPRYELKRIRQSFLDSRRKRPTRLR